MDLNFIKDLQGVHVLIAGEVGIDEYIWGDSSRISPEAPVPVVEVESQTSKLGLGANVAQNVVSLGAKATLVSLRGHDPDGDKLAQMIVDAGIHHSILIGDESRPTLRKVRILAQKQHVVRVDYERSHGLDAKIAKQFTDSICDQIPTCDAIIVQDYGKGLWNPDTMSFVRQAKSYKRPIFVDPSRMSSINLYKGTTLLTPNVAEAEALCGLPHDSKKTAGKNDERLLQLAKKMLSQAEAEHVVITCGESGMVSLSKESPELSRIPTYARDVFDVTGAGDTVVAVLTLMMVLGHPLARCMQIANAAAGIVVGQIGAASVTPMELRAELERLKEVGLLH